MSAPTATHRRTASCEEVNCPHYLKGWITIVPIGSPQDLYIRHHSGRRFTAKAEAGSVTFTFPPGQQCFRQHTATLNRPPFLLRGRNGRLQRVSDPHEWSDTFNETMHQAEQARKRG